MTQYCIYLRKSREDTQAEQRGEGETLARHEKLLTEFARKRELNVTAVYREIVSGETIDARPVMKRLLKEVEKGVWAGVLVVEVERLARGDPADQSRIAKTFKYTDTLIITPNKTYDPSDENDEEYFEFGLFMSRREYKTITRRMQRGRIDSVKEGKYVGNQPPYGYERVKLKKEKGWSLEPVKEEAEVVRMIYESYINGEVLPDGSHKRLGVSLIVKRLNKMKIPAKKGGIWVTASVRDILINPVYAGKIRWNWRPVVKKMTDGNVTACRPRAKTEDCIITEGLHEAIVEESVWNEAQELMKQNPPRPVTERNAVKNPLAGLVICGKCGRRMVRRPYAGGEPDTLICPVTGCGNVSSHLYLVEKRLLAALKTWLCDYKLQWDSAPPKNNNSCGIGIKRKALAKAENELKTLNGQIGKARDLLERGVYGDEEYLTRKRELTERIKLSEEECRALKSDLEFEETREERLCGIIPRVERLLDVYDELKTPKDKNELLKEVLEKAVYTKNTGGRRNDKPDCFELAIYPKIAKSSSIT